MTKIAIAPRIASSLARRRLAPHEGYSCHLRSRVRINIFHDASRTFSFSAHRTRLRERLRNPRTAPGPVAGHDTKPAPKPSALAKKKKHFNLNPAVHGKHAVKFGDENDIFIGTRMKPLKTTDFPDYNNPANLNIAMAETHNFSENHYQYLEQREHPFFLTLTDMYLEKKRRDSLWFAIRTAPRTCCIAVARLADKKIRQCLKKALWEYGYELSGRRRETGEPTTIDGEGNPKMSNHVELYGTIKIGAWDGIRIMQTDPRKLVESLKGIVPIMEAQLGVNEDGRFSYANFVEYNYKRLDRSQGLEEIQKAKDEFMALPEAPHVDRFGRTTGEASRTMAAALKNSQIETARLLGEADLSRWAEEQIKKQGPRKKEKKGFVSLLDVAGDLTKVAEEEVNAKRPRGSASARVEENKFALDPKALPITEDSFVLPDWWIAKRSATVLDTGVDILEAVQAQVDKSAKALSEKPRKPQLVISNTSVGTGSGVAKRELRKAELGKETPHVSAETRPPMGASLSIPGAGTWAKPAGLPNWTQAGPVRFVPQPETELEVAEEASKEGVQEEKVQGEKVQHILDASHEFDEMQYPPDQKDTDEDWSYDDGYADAWQSQEKTRRRQFSLLDTAQPATQEVNEQQRRPRRQPQQQWKRYSLDDSGRATQTEEVFPHDAQDPPDGNRRARGRSSQYEDSHRLERKGGKKPGSRRWSLLDTDR